MTSLNRTLLSLRPACYTRRDSAVRKSAIANRQSPISFEPLESRLLCSAMPVFDLNLDQHVFWDGPYIEKEVSLNFLKVLEGTVENTLENSLPDSIDPLPDEQLLGTHYDYQINVR